MFSNRLQNNFGFIFTLHHLGVPFATLESSGVYFRKEVPSVRRILESSSRCLNIQAVAPPNNHVFHVPYRLPWGRVQGKTTTSATSNPDEAG